MFIFAIKRNFALQKADTVTVFFTQTMNQTGVFTRKFIFPLGAPYGRVIIHWGMN
jgi:hypothetical protein